MSTSLRCIAALWMLGCATTSSAPNSGPSAGEIAAGVLGAIINIGAAVGAAQSAPLYPQPVLEPMQFPVRCTTMPDGWGGSTTTCH